MLPTLDKVVINTNKRDIEQQIDNSFGQVTDKAGEDFLETRISFGIIMHCSLKQINEIKKRILEVIPSDRIVYNRISSNKLWVCEDKNRV